MPWKWLFLILFLLSSSISAQVIVRLYPEAEVAGDQILLGDIAEIQGDEDEVRTLAQIPVGVAPLPGGSRTIHRNADLAPRLRRAGYRPEDFLWEGPESLRVTAKADFQKVGKIKKELEAQLLAYLNTHEEGRNYRWEVKILPESIPSWAAGGARLRIFGQDLPAGRVTLRAEAGQPPLSFTCEAEISAWGKPLVTREHLASGSALDETAVARSDEVELTADILAGKRPLFQLDENLVLLRSLPAGTILTSSDVDYPLLVKKGEPVTIFFQQGAISVQAQGLALEDGRLGSRIQVKNDSSGKIVEGTVVGEGMIEVGR